jgi:uncharacterized membrane protein
MNKMKKLLPLAFAIILFSAICHAATISGTAYDESLDKMSNVIVEINTVPKQTFVAKNGEYSFEVPKGNYIIEARFEDYYAKENAIVETEGRYIIDLILFPELEEMPPVDEDIGSGIIEEKPATSYIFLIIGLIIGAAIVLFFVICTLAKRKKKQKAELSEDLQDLIRIIKKQGGRATQKEIRKEIPLSEAKISLMIAELEHKGIVEKIKKGRGNIVVLKE